MEADIGTFCVIAVGAQDSTGRAPWTRGKSVGVVLAGAEYINSTDFEFSEKFPLKLQVCYMSKYSGSGLGLTLEFLSYIILENFMRNEFRISRKNASRYAKFRVLRNCLLHAKESFECFVFREPDH